jgi:septal ring factor EnvC (AmiA/AmiB activator)
MFVWQSTYQAKVDECESLQRKHRSLEIIHEGYKKECVRDLKGKIDNISVLQEENDRLKNVISELESSLEAMNQDKMAKKPKKKAR